MTLGSPFASKGGKLVRLPRKRRDEEAMPGPQKREERQAHIHSAAGMTNFCMNGPMSLRAGRRALAQFISI